VIEAGIPVRTVSADGKPTTASPSEAEETIEAIHGGDVDAVVVKSPEGLRVLMLEGADQPYRMLVERMNDGALTLGPDNAILYANQRLSELMGRSPADLVGKQFNSLFADASPGVADGGPREATLLGATGALPVAVWSSSISMGGLSARLVTITDLSMQRRAEEIAIAERFARSIVEQAAAAIVVLASDGRITHASGMAEEIATAPPVGRLFSDVFPLDVQTTAQAGILSHFARESLNTALATKPFHGVEVKLHNRSMSKRFFLLSAGPLLNDAKEPVGSMVTLTDITARKRAEDQQTMLVAELNHRVKNILAIVNSVAAQTVRASPSLASFSTAFSGRIKALALAHDILTRTRWIGIGLSELLRAVLEPHRGTDQTRVTLQGPPVLLPAQAVMPLSMVMHELATNASKYGALSVPQGTVAIDWTLRDNGTPRVDVTWIERGGPRVEPQGASGFGTKLIDRVVGYDLDGKADLSFEPGGLRAVLSFPLKIDTASPETSWSTSQPM
jgi:two-component sensor histidine kinase/PAS domain-containing protein